MAPWKVLNERRRFLEGFGSTFVDDSLEDFWKVFGRVFGRFLEAFWKSFGRFVIDDLLDADHKFTRDIDQCVVTEASELDTSFGAAK